MRLSQAETEKRNSEITSLLAEGKTYNEIVAITGASKSTISTIKKSLDVNNKIDISNEAMLNGYKAVVKVDNKLLQEAQKEIEKLNKIIAYNNDIIKELDDTRADALFYKYEREETLNKYNELKSFLTTEIIRRFQSQYKGTKWESIAKLLQEDS